MTVSSCSLCGLPTPDEPVTGPGVDGAFCCRGCLEVALAVDGDHADLDRDDVRDRVRDRSGPGDSVGADGPVTAGAIEAPAPETVATEARAADETTDPTTADPSTDGTTAVPEGHEAAFCSVDGMHCTTCEAFVELLGEGRDGVERVEVSYATELARVVYDPEVIEASALPDALSGHGYDARLGADHEERGADQDTVQRLLVGGFLAMLIMPWYVLALYPSYVGIETGILSVDANSGVGTFLPFALLGVLTTIVVGFTGAPILRGASVSLRTRQPNMDLLIAVAVLSAWLYSTIALVRGQTHLYYDVSVAVILVVTLGSYYESRVKARATRTLGDLTTQRVDDATRRTDDGHETVSVDDLRSGDEVVVSAGDRIPIDGTVLEGTAPVDESLLTGESLPATREPGDAVAGGTVAHEPIVVEVGEEAASTLDRLAARLWSIQTARPGAQRLVDRLSTVFVPLVLCVAVLAAAVQLSLGASAGTVVLTGLTVLVVSCPCAMGLATPLAVAAGLRDGLASGVAFVDETVFETAPDADTVVFDKTGTLTTGEMTVQRVVGDEAALADAAAIERRADHPVADAVVEAVEDGQLLGGDTTDGDETVHGETAEDELTDDETPADPTPSAIPAPTAVESVERHPGAGIDGVVDGRRVVAGTAALVSDLLGEIPAGVAEEASEARERGRLPVLVGVERPQRADGGVVEDDADAAVSTSRAQSTAAAASGTATTSYAVAIVADREREAWDDVLSSLSDRELVVLTGDDAAAAAPFREHPAVDEVFAGVPPDGKVATIRRLAADRTVAMVGDGTNDAPALAAADLGIAMGGGTASAVDAGDAVLLDDDLRAVSSVFDVASGTRRRLRGNVTWALLYNAVAIPIAAVGLLNPLFAAVAMATSSLLVVANSTRSVE